MRIVSPGSTPSTHVQGPGSTEKAAKETQTQFNQVLGGTGPQATAATSKSKIADLMEGLTLLANDVKQGKLSKEDLSRQFVGLVIEKRINLSQFSKDVKTIENAVAEVLEKDPQFASLLESNIKKLGTT